MHKLVYLIALLGAVHFVMLRKGLQIEPLVFLAIVLIVLATRLKPGALFGRPKKQSVR